MKLATTKTIILTVFMLYGRLASANLIVCKNEDADGSKTLIVKQQEQQVVFLTPEGANTFKAKPITSPTNLTHDYELQNENSDNVGDLKISRKTIFSRAPDHLGNRTSVDLNLFGKNYFFFYCHEIF